MIARFHANLKPRLRLWFIRLSAGVYASLSARNPHWFWYCTASETGFVVEKNVVDFFFIFHYFPCKRRRKTFIAGLYWFLGLMVFQTVSIDCTLFFLNYYSASSYQRYSFGLKNNTWFHWIQINSKNSKLFTFYCIQGWKQIKNTFNLDISFFMN